MKKSFVYFLILLVVIGGLVAYIMTRDKDEKAPENGNVVEIVDEEGEEKEEEKVEEEKEVVENTVGFEEYSANRQEAGEVEEGKMFTLEEITDTSEDGYHEFSFS